MSEILLGLKLYFGVVLGQLALIVIIFAVCFILAILCCIFGKDVEE